MKPKLAFVLSILGAAALLTGCIVTSVYPFYTETDVRFEPALLGQWVNKDAENWKFEARGTNAYKVTYGEGTNTIISEGRFFKLSGQSFLDLFTGAESQEASAPLTIPSHMLMRVFAVKPNLKMAPLDYDWLGKLLEKDAAALRHHLVRGSDKPEEDPRIVLTADRAELQRFVIKHLKTAAAWTNVLELKKE